MVLQLYGFSTREASSTLRVAILLHEMKVPFEFHTIDITKGEHKTAEYMKVQDDDGFILFEARAICRYIATKYASQGTQGLLPTELKANALFEQAASIEISNFDPSASRAVEAKVLRPKYRGLEVDDAAYANSINTLNVKLDGYETILSKQRFLGGDEITHADLFHLPNGHVLVAAGSDVFTTRPNIARWWKDLSSREAWLAVQDGVKTTTKY